MHLRRVGGQQVDGAAARLVPSQRGIVLQPVAGAIHVHRQAALIRLGVERLSMGARRGWGSQEWDVCMVAAERGAHCAPSCSAPAWHGTHGGLTAAARTVAHVERRTAARVPALRPGPTASAFAISKHAASACQGFSAPCHHTFSSGSCALARICGRWPRVKRLPTKGEAGWRSGAAQPGCGAAARQAASMGCRQSAHLPSQHAASRCAAIASAEAAQPGANTQHPMCCPAQAGARLALHPPACVKAALVLAVAPQVGKVDEQPVHAVGAQRGSAGKGHEAAADVVAQVLQAGVDGVRTPPEVERVRVVELGAVAVLLGHTGGSKGGGYQWLRV